MDALEILLAGHPVKHAIESSYLGQKLPYAEKRQYSSAYYGERNIFLRELLILTKNVLF